MSEKYPIIGEDDVWSNVLKVIHNCTETDDALEDVIALTKRLEAFSADQIFGYYFEREDNYPQSFKWCIAAIAFARFGKHKGKGPGGWYASQWLLSDIVRDGFSKFTPYLEDGLPAYRLCNLSDFAINTASMNYGWGLNSNGPSQIYSLLWLHHTAKTNLCVGFPDLAPEFRKGNFTRDYYDVYRNFGGLSHFLETCDAIYFSLAAILFNSDDALFDRVSIDTVANFTVSICDDANADDLDNVKSIMDMIEKGENFGGCENFNFSQRNEYHSVESQTVEYAVGVVAKMRNILSEQA